MNYKKIKKLKDLDSLKEFKKLLNQEFRSKLSKELKKLPKKFIYKISIDYPFKSRSLGISFYNKEINKFEKKHDLLYDFIIMHDGHRIKVDENMIRYFLLDEKTKEYMEEELANEAFPFEIGWHKKSPFKENPLTNQSKEFEPNQIQKCFNYYIKLIRERAKNPKNNYIDEMPRSSFDPKLFTELEKNQS